MKPSRSKFTSRASLPEKVAISLVSTVVGVVGKGLYDNYVSGKKDIADLKAKQHAVDISNELAHKDLAHKIDMLDVKMDHIAKDMAHKMDQIAEDIKDLKSKQ